MMASEDGASADLSSSGSASPAPGEQLLVVPVAHEYGELAKVLVQEHGFYSETVSMKEHALCWLIMGRSRSQVLRLSDHLQEGILRPPWYLPHWPFDFSTAVLFVVVCGLVSWALFQYGFGSLTVPV